MKQLLIFLTLTVALLLCLVSCFGQTEHTHNYEDWSVSKYATCTEDGLKIRYCNCGEKQSEVIPATGHNYIYNVCNNCGDVKEAPVCKHENFDVLQGKSPTCTTIGLTEGTKCKKCGKILATQSIIPALGHTETPWIIDQEATKTENGKRHTECTTCGASTKEEIIYATGSVGLNYTLTSNGQSYSVKDIGTCTDTDIIIPSVYNGLPVKSIGEKAFAENATITSIQIPNTVTTIGTRAFYKCIEITEFTIPESVTSIGTQIFYGCDNLTTVYYNGRYGSEDNPFLSVKNLETVVFGGATIPSHVAFGVSTLKTVVLLDSVKSINSRAFEDCSNLTNIKMSDNLTSIGAWAFYGCTALTSITIPKSVKVIDSAAFWDCTNLKDVYITDVEAWLKISFGYSSGSETYPNRYGTLHILDADGNEITDLVISNDFTSIPNNAFRNCSSLTNITIPDSITSIGNSAFDGSGITNITIPDSVTQIGASAFARCSALSCITIPDSVTMISFSMFDGANLTSITIPDSVTSIVAQAFYDCSKLSMITFGGTVAQWNNITKGYWWNSGTGWYVIYCTDGKIFADGTVTYYHSEGLKYALNEDGESYSVTGIGTCTDTDLIIPNTYNNMPVTSIMDEAFVDCTSLTMVTIPNSVTSIGSHAFWNCTKLTSIKIPDTLKCIGKGAFYFCTSLVKIAIPDSVTSIGEMAFCYCNSLTSINIPDSVTSIEKSTFVNCISLQSVTIGDSVTNICNFAFAGCTSLKSIEISDSVTSIGRSAFDNCTSLENVTIGNNVEIIYEYAFFDCASIKSITLPCSVASVGDYVFYNCASLKSVTIPNSVTSIGNYLFGFCTSLTNINFEGTSAEWNAVSKGAAWHYNTGNYIIYCTDGTVSK